MFSHLTSDPVRIQMLQDLLLIELSDFTRQAVYMIENENGKTVRQGRFTGNSTQLSLIHLPLGHYRLGLFQEEEELTCYFEKQEADYIFSGMYFRTGMEKIA